MAEQLTPAQYQAVHNRGGMLLVSAAAGSGKTKVLVDRLMDYLTNEENPANLDEFLIITYTKAAAMELRGKIAAKLTQRIAQEPENRHLQRQMQSLFLAQISTVHGFCAAVLKEYAYKIDLPADFRVADETECEEIRNLILKDLMDQAYSDPDAEKNFQAFVDSQGVGRNDNAIPDVVQKVYDAARCHLNPEQWLDDCLRHVQLEDAADAADTIWGSYLMEDLFSWLDLQIAALSECLQRMNRDEGMEKQAANIAALVEQLKFLRSSTTWDEIYARKAIDFGTLRFTGKKYDPVLADRVKGIRKACKDGLDRYLRSFTNDSQQVISDLRGSAGAAKGIVWLVRRFGEAYAAAKRSRHILDFSDLEHNMLTLLLGENRTGRTAAAREIGARFREILVDEYQDSNGVQDAIFSALTADRGNCFMVGDVKQSIYRFRLADPQIFLKKYRDFAGADEAKPGEGRKIMLSHNFRSGPEVISCINDVFRSCMSVQVGGLEYGEAEALREGVPHVPLGDAAAELYVLDVADGESYEKEAVFTAARIREMLSAGTAVRDGDHLRPVTPDDIVILLRSPSTMGEPFSKALERVGIRCAMGSSTGLMDTPEVSTAVALLRTVANPRQDIPLLSVLASPLFGFTADDLAGIRSECREGCIYDALAQSQSEKAQRFLNILAVLRTDARLKTLTELLQDCFCLTELDGIFGAMPGGKARMENLQIFFQMTADYEQGGVRTLNQFLEYLEASGKQTAVSGSSAGCVTLMSIHKSKGLEFPVVFLCGLSHGFNASDQRDQVLCDKDLGLGLAVADNENRVRYAAISKQAIAASIRKESISEELRILYVAMTRAQDRLIMTCTIKDPASALAKIANRLLPGSEKLLSMEAGCYGDWILPAAMQRTEAGELHVLAGRPDKLHTDDYPWKIRVIDAQKLELQAAAPAQEALAFPQETVQCLREGLAFTYSHIPATQAPSKQTATGRRESVRAEEAREDTQSRHSEHIWRKPGTRDAKKAGTEYGKAVHAVMQFIHYESCTDEQAVRGEILRMQQSGLLTKEQADAVNARQIAKFFESPMGEKLRCGTPYVREFKFSVLDDAEKYGAGLNGEQVLLQGVADCALLEDDGITILDFKTDYVTDETLSETAERYTLQLETYADALSRIFEKKVKAKYLYFFRLGMLYPV